MDSGLPARIIAQPTGPADSGYAMSTASIAIVATSDPNPLRLLSFMPLFYPTQSVPEYRVQSTEYCVGSFRELLPIGPGGTNMPPDRPAFALGGLAGRPDHVSSFAASLQRSPDEKAIRMETSAFLEFIRLVVSGDT